MFFIYLRDSVPPAFFFGLSDGVSHVHIRFLAILKTLQLVVPFCQYVIGVGSYLSAFMRFHFCTFLGFDDLDFVLITTPLSETSQDTSYIISTC